MAVRPLTRLCSAPLLAGAVAAAMPAQADDACRESFERTLSRFERMAWSEIGTGGSFDAADHATDLAGRQVSARFVASLLGCRALQEELTVNGLVLRNIVVVEPLDLRFRDIPIRFSCLGCIFAMPVDARESRWRAPVDLAGTSMIKGVDFSAARFDAGIRARRLLSGGNVAFGEAESGDGMDLVGLVADRALLLRDAHIDGKLLLTGARLDSLDLRGARIGRRAILSGIAVARHAAMGQMAVGGDLVFHPFDGRRPTIGAVAATGEAGEPTGGGRRYVLSLDNAKISGRLDAAGLHVAGPASLDAVRVDEDIWLRRCSRIDGALVMPFARIGQNFDLSTTRLGGLDATGTRIAGELRLGTRNNPRLTAPSWAANAAITLRNVSAAAWTDSYDSPNQAERCDGEDIGAGEAGTADPWPRTIDVIGFEYRRIGGLGGSDERIRPARWYVDWLDRQQPFSLEPYRRLADFLADNGLEAAAQSVRYAGKERQLETSQNLTKLLLFLQKIFVGYGIYTWYVLFWMMLFVGIGAVVFSRSREAKASGRPLSLAYSIDMFLPFISLRGSHGSVEFDGPVRCYLYLHKAMGWICALFFVSALAGLFEV